jgi:tetratricopeptide (TPR) repeat protein
MCHDQGLCHYSMGRLEVALEHFRRALAMSAEYEKARSWIEKVTQELASKANLKNSSNSTMTITAAITAAATASDAATTVGLVDSTTTPSGTQPSSEIGPQRGQREQRSASSASTASTASLVTAATASDAAAGATLDSDRDSDQTVDLSGSSGAQSSDA